MPNNPHERCLFCDKELDPEFDDLSEYYLEWRSSEIDAVLLEKIVEQDHPIHACRDCAFNFLVDGPTIRINISYELIPHWEE